MGHPGAWDISNLSIGLAKRITKLRNGPMQHRVDPLRSDLRQRLKDEEPLMHRWVGQGKPGLKDDEIVVNPGWKKDAAWFESALTRAFVEARRVLSTDGLMVIVFAQSPAGLTLYYLIFNLMGLLQTWLVIRSYEPEPIKV